MPVKTGSMNPPGEKTRKVLKKKAITEKKPAPGEKGAEKKPAARKKAAVKPCKVAFIGSECYPFVKTGGLGDVMYALPRALSRQNCEIRVFLPYYRCISEPYRSNTRQIGEFSMDLCADGRRFYVGIRETVVDGVTCYLIENDDFFGWGNPYTDLVLDIPKYCFFSKAALAVLNWLEWIPDVIHCHDWQTGLVPVYMRSMFNGTPVSGAKSVLTIHNLRFQGVCNIPTIQYWSGLPGYVFDYTTLREGYEDASMFKGGLAYANAITTVSRTYADEIQTQFYGEGLDAHLRYHSGKLYGIVNGIDTDIWNPASDGYLTAPYDQSSVLKKKPLNKLALQEKLGLMPDERKFMIGLVSRLTDQKGLDLLNEVLPQMLDGNTQVAVLGTGDRFYEDELRRLAQENPGTVSVTIAYNEDLAHQIYAGTDVLTVPSLFEPCGLTQLIAMRYGTVPVVRETGGLKDTVLPYTGYLDDGNGFTFDRYEAGHLLDALTRARDTYFQERKRWNQMMQRNMEKDVSWEESARLYKELYLQLR